MENHKVAISVIVPFLNEEKYIGRCIDALLGQDFDPALVQFIFVDNNSTDESAAIVANHPEIKLVRESTPHVYAARNTAIRHAQGRILAFTDADCIVSQRWLASILTEFDSGNIDVLLGERAFSDESGFLSRFLEDFENMKLEHILSKGQYRKCFGYTNNMAVRRRVYDDLDGFREDIPLADTDLVLRYVAATKRPRIGYSHQVGITHLEIGSSLAWLKKLVSYGKHSPESSIPLYVSWNAQLDLIRYSRQRLGYSLGQTFIYFLTMTCANLAYLIPYLMSGGYRMIVRGAGD